MKTPFFKSPFSKAKKVLLGLDVGYQSTKIVHLVHSPGEKPRVIFFGIFRGSPGDSLFPQKLHQYLAHHGLTGLASGVSIDDPTLKIRKLELPKMPEADLREAVKWKMRDVIEGSIDDYVVRYSILAEKDGKKLTLVGYAIRRVSVTHIIHLLQKAGLKVEFVEPAAVSLSACIELQQSEPEKWVAGIDLGASRSLMVIMGGGRFVFSRPLSGVRVDDQTAADAGFNQKLAAEIQNALDTFAVTFHAEEISHIFLSGGGADFPGLAEYLTTNLGIRASVLDPFNGVEWGMNVEKDKVEKPALYSHALSMALVQV